MEKIKYDFFQIGPRVLGSMSLEQEEPFWTHVSTYKLQNSFEMGNFVTSSDAQESFLLSLNFQPSPALYQTFCPRSAQSQYSVSL